MMLNRRGFLASGVAACMPLSGNAQGKSMRSLTAQKAMYQLAPAGYPQTEIWGYDGRTPGPEIRVMQGGRVQRQLVNTLDHPTSVHWHGIRIDNAMDGVAGLTQDAVPTGDTFDYDFVAPDAGTYWYHAHNMSAEQVGRGLYGPLIIEEPNGPDIDAEHVLMLDDWRLNQKAAIDPNFAAMHDLSHGGRIGNFVTTNAIHDLNIDVSQNQRLRLRLVNAGNARIFTLGIQGLTGWVVAYDGMPLAVPEKVTGVFELSPAQRVDLIVDVTADAGDAAYLVRADGDGTAVAQVTFPVTGRAAVAPRGPFAGLPPNAGHVVGVLEGATLVDMKLEGGAMGGLRSARLNGEEMGFRTLARSGQFWAMAGAVGMPDKPLVTASRGESVRISMPNDTVFAHAMHLHGQHFNEVYADGSLGPMRDTTLIEPRQTRDIVFRADNPGEWLLHCHMLGHAASGMMQRIRIVA